MKDSTGSPVAWWARGALCRAATVSHGHSS